MNPLYTYLKIRVHAWLLLPFLCKLGLHWGTWKSQPNFHSHHALQVWRCTRCPDLRVRIVWLHPRRKPSQNNHPLTKEPYELTQHD